MIMYLLKDTLCGKAVHFELFNGRYPPLDSSAGNKNVPLLCFFQLGTLSVPRQPIALH